MIPTGDHGEVAGRGSDPVPPQRALRRLSPAGGQLREIAETMATEETSTDPGGLRPEADPAASNDLGAEALVAEEVRGASTAFSDIASVSGARAATIALSLLTTILVTHLLRPRQYAVLAYIALLSGVMFTIAASWSAAAVVRYGREELERDGTLRATSWSRLRITFPLLVLTAVAVTALQLLGLLPSEVTWPVVAIAIGTGVAAVAGEHVNNLLEASGRMKLAASTIAGAGLVSVLALVVLALAGVAHSAVVVAVVWMLGAWLVASVMCALVWRIALWPPRSDRALRKRMVRFAVPLIAFAASQYVIQAVDIVVLGQYRSARDVGLYAIAYNGYGVLQQLVTTATIVLSPLFVSLREAGQEHIITRYLQRLMPQALLLASIGAGLAAAVVPTAVPILFGPHFAPAAKPLALLLIAWLMYALASFVASIIVLHERGRFIAVISCTAAAVNAGLDLLFVGGFGVGISGPAIATSVSLAVLAFAYLTCAAKCVGMPASLPVAALAPGIAGILSVVLIGGVAGSAGAVGLTLLLALGAIRVRKLVSRSDLELLERLDMPQPVKSWTLRAVARLP
jgi:O-antigen/teichoic acid export membrane protein